MAARTRADQNPDRTATEASDEKEGWVEAAKDETEAQKAFSGSRPADKVTPEMEETPPWAADQEGAGTPEQPVNQDR